MNSEGLCAIKFGATWCGPCKTLEPKLKKIKEEYSDISFLDIDVDDNPSLAKEYKIRSLPTVILLKDGRELRRVTGAALITPLRKAFSELKKKDEVAA